MNDTEQCATYRYMTNGFGKLGSKKTYQRYSQYVDWLREKQGKSIIQPRKPYFKIEDYFEKEITDV